MGHPARALPATMFGKELFLTIFVYPHLHSEASVGKKITYIGGLKVNTIYLKLRLTLSKRKWKSNWMHAKLDTNIIWNVYFLKISLFPYGERKLKS